MAQREEVIVLPPRGRAVLLRPPGLGGVQDQDDGGAFAEPFDDVLAGLGGADARSGEFLPGRDLFDRELDFRETGRRCRLPDQGGRGDGIDIFSWDATLNLQYKFPSNTADSQAFFRPMYEP